MISVEVYVVFEGKFVFEYLFWLEGVLPNKESSSGLQVVCHVSYRRGHILLEMGSCPGTISNPVAPGPLPLS